MDTASVQVKSRKQRRKASSMRDEYYRRQRKNAWLETHKWHAKRMKMVNKYGFRLAEHCNDKGLRAMQRSLVHGCLMSVSLVAEEHWSCACGLMCILFLCLYIGHLLLQLQ